MARHVTFIRLVHSKNAPTWMELTELGIVILDNPEQPTNAPVPIVVIEFGMTVFMQPVINVLLDVSMMALQLSRES